MSLVAWYPLNGNLKDNGPHGYDLHPECYKYGDINGDGYINDEDATLAMEYYTGSATLTSDQIERADVNGDGEINARDSKLITQLKEGKISVTKDAPLGNPVWSQPRITTKFEKGKTGQAFSITSEGDATENIKIPELTNSDEMSVTLWVKVNSINTSFSDFITFRVDKEGTSPQTLRLEPVKAGSATDVCYLNWYANGFYWDDSGMASGVCKINIGEWYHVAFSISRTSSSFYLNGVRLHVRTHQYTDSDQVNLSGHFRMGSYRSQSSYFTGAICNVKIYNHILTRSEINADYKQPILHYNFENPYVEPTTNINHTLTKYTKDSGDEVTLGNDNIGNYALISVRTQWQGLKINDCYVEPGKYYTWSMDVMCLKDTRYVIDPNVVCTAHSGNDATHHTILRGHPHDYSNGKGLLRAGIWQRIYLTIKIKDDCVTPRINHTFCPEFPEGDTEVKIYYKNSQLEEKPYNTPLVNSNGLYTSFSSVSREAGQIKDVSGMGHHAVKQADESLMPNWNPDDCAIGSYSVEMKDNKKYIRIPPLFSNDGGTSQLLLDELTISIWFKRNEDTIPSRYYTNLFTNHDNGGCTLWIGYCMEGNALWAYVPVWTGSSISFDYVSCGPKTLINKDEWNLCTYTFNKGVSKIYLNGKCMSTTDSTPKGTRLAYWDAAYTKHYYIGMCPYGADNWDSVLDATIDDFRIYPVALNDKDVLDLYQMKGKVDSDGNLFTNQLVETRPQNEFKGLENIKSMGTFGSGTVRYTYKDGIGTATYLSQGTPTNGTVGCYFVQGDLGVNNSVTTGSKYEYSFWVRLPVSGNWRIGWERMYQSPQVSYYEANKWYYINMSGATNSNAYQALVFYYLSGNIPIGSEIQVRDLYFARLEDDNYYNKRSNSMLAKIENPTVVYKDGAKWLRVFHHNNKNKTVLFTDEAEALNIQTEDKYSILTHLEMFRGPDECFEFLLEYPDQHPGKFNRWKQLNNPAAIAETIDSSATVDNNPIVAKGYEPIHIDWGGMYWGGLLKQTVISGEEIQTLINGTLGHKDWYYAIGCYNKANWQGGAIPGPVTSGSAVASSESLAECTITTSVDLYVRLDNIEDKYIPKVTKKGQLKTYELSEFDDKDIETNHTVIKHGKEWHQVFHHNIGPNKDQWFKDEAEALHCDSKYKYSILDQLEDFRGSDGKFEFLLEYPLDLPGQYNHWKQTDNPATVVETTTQATGYEAIHVDWTTRGWLGLLKHSSTTPRTFIDGGTLSNWYYAIGCYNNSTTDWHNALPGPNNNSSNTMHEVNLYVASDINYIGATIKRAYGAEWLRVFHHNSKNGTILFANEEEALFCIEDPNKYSILRRLENFRGKDGKFEFLLEWPEDYPAGYMRWRQSKNPLDDNTVYEFDTNSYLIGKVEGYEEIYNPWYTPEQRWAGLLRNQHSNLSLLDGIIGDHWYYAIGAYQSYSTSGSSMVGIPGPEQKDAWGKIATGPTELYVRIDNIDNRNKIFKLQKRKALTKEIIEI